MKAEKLLAVKLDKLLKGKQERKKPHKHEKQEKNKTHHDPIPFRFIQQLKALKIGLMKLLKKTTCNIYIIVVRVVKTQQ